MSYATPQLIKELRERTGAPLGKCKDALEHGKGDIELSIEHLRKTGIASAVKKEGRSTKEGSIFTYETDEVLALLEMNAETDFVVNNEKFHTFQKELVKEAAEENVKDLATLLAKKSKKDPSKTVDEQRRELISVLGENINISRFALIEKTNSSSFGVYSHMKGKLLCVVEVSGSEQEEELCKEVAMHVAAESPEYLDIEEVPKNVKDKEEEIARSIAPPNKPKEVLDKIIEGKVRAFYDQVCLLRQKFIKDPSVTVAQVVEKRAKEIGKPLKIVRFIRWSVGS